MQIPAFKLERYFAQYEFKVQYLLSPSDCEALTLADLLDLADAESLALWQGLHLSYTESAGHPLLRNEVASLYQTITPDDLLIAVPEEAIFVAMNTLLRPGDHLVAISPAYQSLYEIAQSIGCTVTAWPVQLSEQGWHLDLAQLAASITPRTRLLVINFPHNPTGYLPSPALLEGIVALARQHDLYLFSDEMYRGLEFAAGDQLPAICDSYEKGISLSGLSKSYALPGLRIGWLATHDRPLLEQCLAFKDYTTICNSAPSEVLAIMALRARSQIVRRNLAIIQHNLTVAEAFFAAHHQFFRWIKPQAGSIAFPHWQGNGSVEQFCQGLLDARGVMVVPGSIFDHPGSHFRVGLGRRNLAEVLEQVDDYLKEYTHH